MLTVNGLVTTAQWPITRDRVYDTIVARGMAVIETFVAEAYLAAVVRAPVYQPTPGAPFETPPQRRSSPTTLEDGRSLNQPDEDEFFGSVIRTLMDQYNIPEPTVGQLRQSISPPGWVQQGDVAVCGFASRQVIEAGTDYKARILLQMANPPPSSSNGRSREGRVKQWLWWNWEKNVWESGSKLGLPSGGTAPMSSVGDSMGGWRGNIPAGAGYWADVEFGTQEKTWTGLPPGSLDGDANLVMLFLNGATLSAVPTSRRGIPPSYYLSTAAMQVADQLLRAPGNAAAQRQFQAAVAAAL